MTAHIRSSILAASLLIVCLSGCQPSVNSVTVTPGTDVNLVNVQANISSAPAASMGTPVIRVASLADNPPVFHAVPGGFTQKTAPTIGSTDWRCRPGRSGSRCSSRTHLCSPRHCKRCRSPRTRR